MNPREQLAYELSVEQTMREGERLPPLTPEEHADQQRRLRATLQRLGLEADTRPQPASTGRLSFVVQTDPGATLAAADLVRLSQRFELGVVRMLQSPLRADLAVEVVLDADQLEAHGDQVFFVKAASQAKPIAVIPNASPVFCGLYAEDFVEATTLAIDAAPAADLDPGQLEAVRRSRRSLRDPGDRARYDAVLGGGAT